MLTPPETSYWLSDLLVVSQRVQTHLGDLALGLLRCLRLFTLKPGAVGGTQAFFLATRRRLELQGTPACLSETTLAVSTRQANSSARLCFGVSLHHQ